MSKTRTAAMIAVAAIAATAATSTVTHQGASASAQHHVFRTGSAGLNLRSGPNAGSARVAFMPEGAAVDVACFTLGSTVNGNPVWLSIRYGNRAGYATDYYIDTRWQTTQDLKNQGVPDCAAQPSSAPLQGSSPNLQGSSPCLQGSCAPPAPQTTPTQAGIAGAEQAIAWAEARTGHTAYDGWCLLFVYQAYQAAGINNGRATTAYDWWAGHGASQHPGDRNPPRGALVFWRSANGAPGHVAISLGGGVVISTWDGRTNGVHHLRIRDYTATRYLGWVAP